MSSIASELLKEARDNKDNISTHRNKSPMHYSHHQESEDSEPSPHWELANDTHHTSHMARDLANDMGHRSHMANKYTDNNMHVNQCELTKRHGIYVYRE